MIINLVGAPAAGKSTFAARFVVEHPEFKFCPIDEYRIRYEHEALAWDKLKIDLIHNNNVIIESCGFNWRLREIFNIPFLRKKPIITIAFTGDITNLETRLHLRQKREVPFEYGEMDEIASIKYVAEHLSEFSVLEIDQFINTNDININKIYEEGLLFINERRLHFAKNRFKRTERVYKGKTDCNI